MQAQQYMYRPMYTNHVVGIPNERIAKSVNGAMGLGTVPLKTFGTEELHGLQRTRVDRGVMHRAFKKQVYKSCLQTCLQRVYILVQI